MVVLSQLLETVVTDLVTCLTVMHKIIGSICTMDGCVFIVKVRCDKHLYYCAWIDSSFYALLNKFHLLDGGPSNNNKWRRWYR